MTVSTEEWRKYNILIMDDEPHILEQIERDLLLERLSLIKASSTDEALQIVGEREVHVALCDQKMPGMMSGTKFLQEARKKQPHLVGMILSAFDESEYLFSAINEAKAFYYLLKPWNKQELIERIHQALQFFHSKILEEQKKKEEALKNTQTMLTRIIHELSLNQKVMHETALTLATISDVTGQLSTAMRQKIRTHDSKI